MATFLFDKIIFGPIQSRRLGVSLGVNLLPVENKVCSFDCIYCECGWNPSKEDSKGKMPTRESVRIEMEKKLIEMKNNCNTPDVITFAGNGEPTLHPKFAEIIDDTIELRDTYCSDAKIAVLSNSTTIQRNSTFEALKKVEDNILKLDSAIPETIQAIDQPCGIFKMEEMISNLSKFKGKCAIQTLFVKGMHEENLIDNTTIQEVEALIDAYNVIRPNQIMIYTIARDTPAEGLIKISAGKLDSIASMIREKTGVEVQVSY